MNEPVVFSDRCVRGLSRLVGCDECQVSCPRGAIEIRRDPLAISIDPSCCDRCGVCWSKCPVEAILPFPGESGPSRDRLLVSCRKAPGGTAELPEGVGLRPPCVRVIGHRFLLARWMSGLRALVVCGQDCSKCDAGLPSEHDDGILKVNEILRLAGEEPIEVSGYGGRPPTGRLGPARQEMLSRRATSRRGFVKGLIAAALDTALPPVEEKAGLREGLGHYPRFLAALEHLGGKKGTGRAGLLAAYRLSISLKACYGCSVCATLCPTRALVWDQDAGPPHSARLEISASRCHGCGVCSDVCDVGAIEAVFEPGFYAEETVLFGEASCSECSRAFLSSRSTESTTELCPGCRAMTDGVPSQIRCREV